MPLAKMPAEEYITCPGIKNSCISLSKRQGKGARHFGKP